MAYNSVSVLFMINRKFLSQKNFLMPMFQLSGVKRKTLRNKQSSLDSYVKIAHLTEIKPTLLKVLESHRDAIAILGDPLGGTHCAEHHIKLKPGTNPVYINEFKLPYSQNDKGYVRVQTQNI